MHRLACLIICALSLLTSCNRNGGKSIETVNPNWKRIPDSWIKKATAYTYSKKPDTGLLSECAKLIKPDTLYNPHAEHADPDYGFVFNSVHVDLDGDGNDELLCLQGWDV